MLIIANESSSLSRYPQVKKSLSYLLLDVEDKKLLY